jgi:hypothetical protein
MPIRRSPNGAGYTRPQPGRDRPEWAVAINRNARSQSIGIGGRNQPVRATSGPEPYWKLSFRAEAGVSPEEWTERLQWVLRDSVA